MQFIADTLFFNHVYVKKPSKIIRDRDGRTIDSGKDTLPLYKYHRMS